VAIIDGGSTVGCGDFISGLTRGGHLTFANEPLLVGGVPVLKDSGLKLKAVPASGMYIDELRISRVVRYDVGAYNTPVGAFTSDDDTLGLYHFDGELTERYEDASRHQIRLVRVKRKTELGSNQ